MSVVIGIYLVEFGKELEDDFVFYYTNSLLTFSLGISVFFCLSILAEKQKLGAKSNLFLQFLGILFLLGIYFSFPGHNKNIDNLPTPYIRYILWTIIMHLMVSFVPYLFVKGQNGFWNYNKTLFIRICTAVLYSIFLYGGLSLALLAIQNLFEIDIPVELYFEIFIVVAGLFNTWFFVAGIPRNLEELEDDYDYPKGLKNFAQYVLIPLVSIYLLILYAYCVKIVGLWDWPKGLMSYLVSLVSILGIFTLLLIYPYGKAEENSWIRKMSKAYYFVLIPLIAVLFIAIGFRVADYGITINRYLVILLGIWLSLVALYFIFFGDKIKFIPISLVLFLLLASYGPLSMFSVSQASQSNRLIKILETNGLLNENGKIKNEVIWDETKFPKLVAKTRENKNNKMVSDSVSKEIQSIISYLEQYGRIKVLNSLVIQDFDLMIKNRSLKKGFNSSLDRERLYIKTIGFSKAVEEERVKWVFYDFGSKRNPITDVRKYDYTIDFTLSIDKKEELIFLSNKKPFKIYIKDPNKNGGKIYVEFEDKVNEIEFCTFIEDIIKKQKEKNNYESLRESEMYISKQTEHLNIKIQFNSIVFEKSEGINFSNLSGYILIKVK